ncbi:MAG: hypothetical protein AAFR84_02985 [Pseudomonadota bacterium]
MSKKIIAYKGFDRDLRCRGFQYEVGATFEHEGEVEICESGFHACPEPFDVWSYYPPAEGTRFAEVELSGATDKGDDKVAAAKLTVVAELTLPAFIERAVAKIVKAATSKKKATGYRSAATNTGHQSAATNTGYQSAATNTGYQSAATNTGYRSAATNTGYRSAATNTGHQSAATNTGHQSAATNTGHQSAATNTGYRSAASVEGKHSVAHADGYGGRAKASDGSAITLVERDYQTDKILHAYAGIAGRGEIEPDTWYTLEDGKPVKWEAA